METARILVFGNVQGDGFRAYVKQIARNMQIRGFARNLDDGSVEIYAQAPKPEIDLFVERITIAGNPSDPLSLHVAKITTTFEHSKDFRKPGKKLKAFEIDYGKRLRTEAKETIEKAEIVTLMMHSLRSETQSFRKESSESFKNLGSNITNNFSKLDNNITTNFDRLDNKYGSVSHTLKSINNSIKTMGGSVKHMGRDMKQNNKILSRIARHFESV